MTMEHFIVLSVIGMCILGMINMYIAYLSCRLLKETITIRKDTVRIRAENILIREISEQVRDKL